MTLKKFIGYAMLLAPFVAMFIFGLYDKGVKATLAVFAATVVLGVFVWVAVKLATSDN